MSDNQAVIEATKDIPFEATFKPLTELAEKFSDNRFNFEIRIGDYYFPYFAGIGHSKSYKGSNTVEGRKVLEGELTGKKYIRSDGQRSFKGVTFQPSKLDVLYCLVMDSYAIACFTFEEWAEDFDRNTDSREDERIYRDCIENALKLRNAIGNDKLEELKELFQEY